MLTSGGSPQIHLFSLTLWLSIAEGALSESRWRRLGKDCPHQTSANGNPIIAIFQTRAAHVILKLMLYVFQESITFILFLFSCKIISIVLLKLNSNQMCFLFLEHYENREGIL